jgi:DNA (cytosine-5)-methyltransferase 1
VLDAQNFGVAQRRRRVFVVGCLGGWESAAKVLFESESLRGDIKKGRKSGKEVAGTITARFGNSRNNHEELAPTWPAKTASTLNASFGDKLGLENQHINSGAPLFVPAYAESSFGNFKEDNIAATIRASGGSLSGGSETLYVSDVSATLTASGAGFSRPGHTSTAHENYIAIPIHAQATQYKGGGANRNNDGKGNGLGIGKPGDPMNTLDTSSRHAVAFGFNTNARPDEMNFLENQSNTLTTGQRAGVGCIGGQHPNAAVGENISPTLTNAMGAGGGHVPVISFSSTMSNPSTSLDLSSTLQAKNHTAIFKSMAVRRLTEVECERLQGFPDNYTNIKESCPSGARYKALGNSMAVPVMRWIGERINEYEKRGMA